MRIYHYVPYHLTGIQQGIQSAHAQSELFRKYRIPTQKEFKTAEMLWEWAAEPCMYIMSTGSVQELDNIKSFFSAENNPYPYAHFVEEDLGDMITNVAIVVPEKIYLAYKELIHGKKYEVAIERNGHYTISPRQFSSVQKLWEIRNDTGNTVVRDAFIKYETEFGALTDWDIALIEYMRPFRRA